MTQVGFPDFQEQAQWQSPPAVEYSAALNNGVTKSFPDTGPVYFNVSNWNATQLRINGAQRLDVECIWYDSIPAVAYLARSYFTTAKNISSVVSLPNGGPYLQVNISNLSGSNDTLTAVVAFTNRHQQPFIVPTSGPTLDIEGANVAGGTTRVDDSSYLYAGPAWVWTWSDSNEAWAVDYYGINSSGATALIHHVDSLDNPGGRTQSAQIILPARPIQSAIHNYGVNPHTYYAVITPNYFR